MMDMGGKEIYDLSIRLSKVSMSSAKPMREINERQCNSEILK